MVNKEDIKNLSSLARIKISEEEMESLSKEIDSILEYVGQVKKISGDTGKDLPIVRNVLREDEITHEPGSFTEDLLNNAPLREGSYLKVKKILE